MNHKKVKICQVSIISIFVYLLFFVVGILLGMLLFSLVLQQGIIKVANSLDGVNIEINLDLNETEIINNFNETIVPELEKDFEGS